MRFDSRSYMSYTTRALQWMLALAILSAPAFAFAQDRPAFTQQQLDQMLAPVALYPDPLLSQMFMAATYPPEVAEAARWSKAHPGLWGDDAVRAVTREPWDASVKSLVAFPEVLAWMDQNPGWTRDVGDAFLGQEQQVMDTVQTLRQRAQAEGTLRSNDRNRVVYDAGSIAIEPVDPHVIYVPYYDPLLVYGPWWWPADPPVRWYQPPPPYAGAVLYWGPPIAVSAGFFFGAFDWHHHDVRVARIDHDHAAEIWRHDPAHRHGMAYRNAGLRRTFRAPAQAATRVAGPLPAIHSVPPQVRNDARRPEFSARREPRQNRAPTPPPRIEPSRTLLARPRLPPAHAWRPPVPHRDVSHGPIAQAPRFAQPVPQPPRVAQPAPHPGFQPEHPGNARRRG